MVIPHAKKVNVSYRMDVVLIGIFGFVRQRGILDLRHRDVLKKEALFHGNNLLSIVCIQKRD